MKFIHDRLPEYKLRVGYNDIGRYYVTPDGLKYPSVTTVTSFFGKHKLDAWKARVGDIEAKRISSEASSIGSNVHSMCENYLSNDHISCNNFVLRNLFNTIKPALDNISNIRLLEANLFSDKLQLAGSVDCVANYNDVLSIIDFKTSKKEKPEDWIENYFVQETIYAIMVLELYKIPVKQIVTIITCRDLTLQVIVKPITKELLQLVKKYIDFYKCQN